MAATVVLQKALLNTSDALKYGSDVASRYKSYINVSSVGFKNTSRKWEASSDAAKGSTDATVAAVADATDVGAYAVRRPLTGESYSRCSPIRFTVKANNPGDANGVQVGGKCYNFKVWPLAVDGVRKPYVYKTSGGAAVVEMLYKVLPAGETLTDATWDTPPVDAVHVPYADTDFISLDGNIVGNPETNGDYKSGSNCGGTQWLLLWQKITYEAPIGMISGSSQIGEFSVGSTTLVYSYDEM